MFLGEDKVLDDVLDILSDERRREMLYSMEGEDSDIFGYDELAEELIERGDLSPNQKDEFKAEITHVHLPKLEDGGVIEHDHRSKTVRYVADEEVSEILDFLDAYE